MLSPTTVLCLALSLSTCYAAPAMKQIERVERSVLTQQGWAVASTPAAAAMMTLQIGLALQNTDQLYTTLLDVSNPKSKSYGKWMDRDEANAIVQPSKAADDAVVNWLKSEGVEKVISDGTWVTFATTTETANRLLNANFQQFERHGILKIRTTEYSVPQSLVEHIDLIHPTTFFGKTQAFRPSHLPEGLRKRDITDLVYKEPEKTEKKTARTHTTAANGKFAQLVPPPTNSTVAAGCKTVVTPECLKQFYNVGNYTATASSGSRIGFGSFLNQSAQYADLKMYLETFLIPDQNFTKVFVNNASNSQDPARASDVAGEANLDVQNMIGIAHPLPVFEYLTGGSPPIVNDLEQTNTTANTNEPYLPFYQYLLSKRNSQLPQVISNSYGEPEQTVPRRYAERVCTSIALMGLRGVTVLESSGDTGVGSYCKSNDGTNRDRFLPQFPATCPWITAIGGTESALPEIAWKDSSGGFSDYFSRPDYQNDHVETYLTEWLPEATVKALSPYFNSRGRAFPDISAHSLAPNYAIIYGKRLAQSGGTSASSPVVGGLIGLLNDARFKAKLPSMGFINPWLYSSGEGFLVDITLGAARGCDGLNHQNGKKSTGAGVIPNAFWNATVGWDAVTGLGIPDFQLMLKSALAEDDIDDDGDDSDD